MENILVIGIAGGTGSGKTTLVKRIKEQFGDVVSVLSHDNYYRRLDYMPLEERCKVNYDEPKALETELMSLHLAQLRAGVAIDCPVYDFSQHNRSDETLHIVPTQVIIVEGILIFENKQLRDLMDIRICRRIKRDVNKRGRSLESVIEQYQTTVKPMHEKYVEPSKKYAHIVVPEGGKNVVALDMIMGRIRRHLEEV